MTRISNSQPVFAIAAIRARIAASVLLDLPDTQSLDCASLKAFARTKGGRKIAKNTEFVHKSATSPHATATWASLTRVINSALGVQTLFLHTPQNAVWSDRGF